MDKIKDKLVDAYAKKSGQDKILIDNMMAAETWLTSEDALDMGFATFIDEPLQINAYGDCSKFKNCPDHFKAAAKASKFTPVKDAPSDPGALKSRLAHAAKTTTAVMNTKHNPV